MDTSKEYIKMCEKAEEIQKIQPTSKYFNFWYYNDLRIFCEEDGELEGRYAPRKYCPFCGKLAIQEDNWVVIESYLSPQNNAIWLPRQDQLQEMLKNNRKRIGPLWPAFDLFFWIEAHQKYMRTFYFISMEQLWLAFVMKERYKKIWNRGDWIER